MGALMAAWIAHKRIAHYQKPNSVKAYEVAARRFTNFWTDVPANDFPVQLIEQYKVDRLLRGISPTTVNLDVGLLGNALRWGKRMGLLGRVPEITKVRHMRRRIPKFLDDDAVRRLLDVCRTGGPYFSRLEVIVRLALLAGLRKAEITWLTWADVDLTNGWVNVQAKPGWTPKASAERSIPIGPEFVEWLKLHRERLQQVEVPTGAGDWVAPFTPVDWSGPRRAGAQGPSLQWKDKVLAPVIRRLFERAGVEPQGGHTLHLFRGTFATNVLRTGGDLESLRDMLGHADLKTTAAYLTATSESKRRAVARLKFMQ